MKENKRFFNLSFSRTVGLVLVLLLFDAILKYSSGLGLNNSAEKIITEFASQNNLTLNDYPMEIREMLVRNDETRDFVVNYPNKVIDFVPDKLDFSSYKNCTEPPLLLQWDTRWGYMSYNGNVFGLTGSAPTCLSMVSLYVLHDTSLTPVYISDFAKKNNFEKDPEKLLSVGARSLGLNYSQVLQNDRHMREAVREKGCSVICMFKGEELSQFIVLTKVDDDGKFSIKDPSSKSNSDKKYTFNDLKNNGLKMIWKYSSSASSSLQGTSSQ